MIEFLSKRIERLSKTLERLETLGMTSVSSAGSSKTFRNQEDVRKELERAENEYHIINSRFNNNPVDPTFKEMIVCNRRQY
jgi:Lhr-like helicase